MVTGAVAGALAAVLPLAAAAAAVAVLPGTSSAKSRLTDLVCALEMRELICWDDDRLSMGYWSDWQCPTPSVMHYL